MSGICECFSSPKNTGRATGHLNSHLMGVGHGVLWVLGEHRGHRWGIWAPSALRRSREKRAKLSILYLETALEQINATALLPDKILFQVPLALMAFRGCFNSPAGSCPKKHANISQAPFCSERGTRRYCCVGRGCVLCKRLTGK